MLGEHSYGSNDTNMQQIEDARFFALNFSKRLCFYICCQASSVDIDFKGSALRACHQILHPSPHQSPVSHLNQIDLIYIEEK